MSVHTLQVTLGAGATQIVAASTPVRQVIFQNNAAANMRVGDLNVSATRGGLLAGGSPGGQLNSGPLVIQATNLNEWFVFGTAAQILDVIFID